MTMCLCAVLLAFRSIWFSSTAQDFAVFDMAIEDEIGLARRGRGVGLLHGREDGAEQPNLPTLILVNT